MKILTIKKLITTILLYMGFPMVYITKSELNTNITKEYTKFVSFAENFTYLDARVKIKLTRDELIKVIKTKITSTEIESNGIKTANITKNIPIVPKTIILGLIFISSLISLTASQVSCLIISR